MTSKGTSAMYARTRESYFKFYFIFYNDRYVRYNVTS
jgi:hypothetical protein